MKQENSYSRRLVRFVELVGHEIESGSSLYSSLKAKQFIYDDSSSPNLDLLATKYPDKACIPKRCAQKLHIFVVTLHYIHSCHYCQVSRQTASHDEYDMSVATADRSIELDDGSRQERILP